MPSTVKKRSVVVEGHRTSVSLEHAFWEAFREIAVKSGKTINQLVSEIDKLRPGNLSSGIRVFILSQARSGFLGPVNPAPATNGNGEGMSTDPMPNG